MENKLYKYKQILIIHIALAVITFFAMILCCFLRGETPYVTLLPTVYLVTSVIMFVFFKNNIGNNYKEATTHLYKTMAAISTILIILANLSICFLIRNYCIGGNIVIWSILAVSLLCALFILRICFIFLKHS